MGVDRRVVCYCVCMCKIAALFCSGIPVMPTQIPAVEERVPQASIQKGTPVWADTGTVRVEYGADRSNAVFSIYLVSFSGYCYSQTEA